MYIYTLLPEFVQNGWESAAFLLRGRQVLGAKRRSFGGTPEAGSAGGVGHWLFEIPVMEMVTGHLKRAVLEELVIGYLRALCWRWLLAT